MTDLQKEVERLRRTLRLAQELIHSVYCDEHACIVGCYIINEALDETPRPAQAKEKESPRVKCEGVVCRSCGNTGKDMFGESCVCPKGKLVLQKSL